jgi:hypothetical protein
LKSILADATGTVGDVHRWRADELFTQLGIVAVPDILVTRREGRVSGSR